VSQADTSDEGIAAPQDREAVQVVVADHLARFGEVLTDAWTTFTAMRTKNPTQMAFASASSRGMLVSDFTCEPAHRIFGSLSAASVDTRYGRPWISLAGGAVQVRFRKLTRDLTLCRSDSDRALSLAHHLGDPYLPGMKPFTVLTAGYVLDPADQGIERLALVCHVGDRAVYYTFPIAITTNALADAPAATVPSAVPTDNVTEPGVAQLSLTPLSPPIIRSAQRAAALRLATRTRGAAASAGTSASPTNSDEGSSA
jgi:hypothetical protein